LVFKPCWVLLDFINFPMFFRVMGSFNGGDWVGFTFFPLLITAYPLK